MLSLLTWYVRDIYSLVPQHSVVYILSFRLNLLRAIIVIASIISYAYKFMPLNSIDMAMSLSWNAGEIFGIPRAVWLAIKLPQPQPPDYITKPYGTPWYGIYGRARLGKCLMGGKR